MDPPSLISRFDIDWLQDGARVFVRVFGDVDISSAPQLAEHLRRARQMGHEVVVDLEGVTFMDCSGVRPLLEASAA